MHSQHLCVDYNLGESWSIEGLVFELGKILHEQIDFYARIIDTKHSSDCRELAQY